MIYDHFYNSGVCLHYKKVGSAAKINAIIKSYSIILGMTMIYVYGIVGFTLGFSLGQVLLFHLLRGMSKEKMLNDKHIQFKYGLLNWGVALLFCYGAVALYQSYF